MFQDKRDLLDLYNAMNGTDHQIPDDQILFLTCGKENGTDKDDLWNPYVWREMSAEAMCNIFLKEQGCVIYD